MSTTLADLLFDQAMISPAAPALVDVERTWTFEQASDDAGRVARALSELGVEPGDRVGVHLHKSGDGSIAMHGVVRLGAVAVPLDPASPAARLRRICDDMGIDVVVSHEPRRSAIAELHELHPLRAVVGLESDLIGIESVSRAALAHFDPATPTAPRLHDRAYIITSSGSTGEPKGIVHTHASALAWVELTNDAFDIRSTDRVADIAPHHFDISTLALWAAPRAGAAAIVVPEPHQRLAASHSSVLEEKRVTVWYSVPFLLQQLVRRGDLENRDLSSLRWVMFGGEVMAPRVIADFMESVPSARMANIYGPAEINTATFHVFDSAPGANTQIPIGKPWAGSRVRIVEPTAAAPEIERLVDEGELWIAATTMMDGYWNRDGLDRTRIVDVDGIRWYRTGDLVTTDEDGALTFLGRLDHQVKVRGHRIELEGIEAELEAFDGVDNVVVAVQRGATGEDRLVAGLLGLVEGFDEADFLSSARRVLPAYAVPSLMVELDSAMFTSSGKLDRRKLRIHVIDMLEPRS